MNLKLTFEVCWLAPSIEFLLYYFILGEKWSLQTIKRHQMNINRTEARVLSITKFNHQSQASRNLSDCEPKTEELEIIFQPSGSEIEVTDL